MLVLALVLRGDDSGASALVDERCSPRRRRGGIGDWGEVSPVTWQDREKRKRLDNDACELGAFVFVCNADVAPAGASAKHDT